MDAFLARRMSDARYRLNTSARPAARTAVSSWYESTEFVEQRESSVVLRNQAPVRHSAAVAKEDKPFTKAETKRLADRDTSDGSDGGPCWSDYERVPGTEAGEKGSCRPKKKKAKTEDDSSKKD